MAKFQKMETSDYLDIMKEFECVKRDFGTTKVHFKVAGIFGRGMQASVGAVSQLEN